MLTSLRTRAAAALAAALAVVVLVLAGCGLQPAGSYVPPVAAGSIRPIEGLPEGASVTVTSKNFTEQLILGKMSVLAAKAAGFEVTDLSNAPGSLPARELLRSGQADIMWEYTGTAWLTYLGNEQGIPDQQEQWQAVYDADAANGLTWGAPAELNNTYALAMSRERAEELGVSSISELASLPVNELTFCVDAEFNSRQDGFTPMLQLYDLQRGSVVPEQNIGIYDTGAIYGAVDQGECTVGEVFATDGRIDALDLVVLDDDRNFFPAYNAAPVIYTKTLQDYPALEGVLEQVAAKLNDETMRSLNLKVDVQGEEPEQVAYDWMVAEGLVSPAE
ncbi:glycine betaine ABC transporter substrate-binding protein [Arthrobacter sp. zg-Y820]|uniref:glycine betaine ABC transporter substrate-binding protein n=1 Tax=unclassified Arthrobacter TaxID=235627 RepID=UPI001E2A372F|nr:MULTISPECIES: glycine betaine ABC transporter substrate-binding protein [unclassified Arthrobacter]MCC9195466.1 glycine betaine ABC transporter substrate-binding protein [Arthrobacter sp. zg-Y820]MDK1278325.1 glycine betaine ABC transporter substrate-binding protein [Arthrobacter sp. zg.Y820]WIB10204.1 glycine betaine ABC transporter substrate-binding protein [Arthrobacter sp. zg-Y820]